MSRKFKGETHYSGSGEYHLLPFRFHPISTTREVLVNEVGEYLLCERGTATRLAAHKVEPDEPLYADLAARCFLSEEPTPPLVDVLATKYRTKKSFLDGFTALHIFVVTLRCNHTCHYCQVSRQTEDRDGFDIAREDLDLAIDHMFRSPSPELTMEFQGGEPALAFDLVEYAVERALQLNESHSKTLTFVLCTNATTLTDEILEFCRRNRVLISTSLDGPAFIHDKNRPKSGADSHERAVAGIRRAREALGHDQVAALMTTTPLSLDHPEAIVDEYVRLGFRSIFLRSISPYGFARRSPKKNRYETERFLRFYKDGLRHILTLNRQGVHISEDFATIVLKKILTPFPVGYVDLQSPAGLINSVVVYNYDGGVYASDEARMLAEDGDHRFRLGHVSDDYRDLFYGPLARRIALASANEALAGCADCGFQSYCGADPVGNYATQGDMEGFRPTSSYCARNMEIIRYLFELLDTDPEAASILASWAGSC